MQAKSDLQCKLLASREREREREREKVDYQTITVVETQFY